jgi:choline kinase
MQRPKCLLKIGGHSIIDYQIAALREAGIEDIGIVVGYMSELIRNHLPDRVTLIENREFTSTSSSYSLWLAREFIQDGFIHLNSDLVFEPRLLHALLDAPDPNAVIVDRQVHTASDMMKAQMDGRQILKMNKRLAEDIAAAEVVGPAKFGASGARRIIEYLDELVRSNVRNRWAYDIFGSLAEDLGFAGVDNPGCFWAEIDTPSDAQTANKRIPRDLVEFVARHLETPLRVARHRARSSGLAGARRVPVEAADAVRGRTRLTME